MILDAEPGLLPRWVVATPPDADATDRLAEALALPHALAALLVQRGHAEPGAARRFLRPELGDLADPYALAGMRDAVDAVASAVRGGRTILVSGDYDVDGQCATALLTRALRQAGARVVPFIPHRLRDGYDFGPAALAAAQACGAALVLTCDCGIAAVETVRAARARGIEVVVTDHHLPGAELPPATAIVNPNRPDDRSGLWGLCGTGIAFKLVQALGPVLGLPANYPFHLLDLVALATVADVVPLTGENRVLVRHGLRLLAQSRWPGLRALVASAGLEGRALRAGQVGFILAPRLNAAGRIGDAMDGLALLLADDAGEAARLAADLGRLNDARQALDQRILDEAMAQVRGASLPPAVVLADDGWHAGVVGIVASRVVERFGRPTFLVALDGAVGKGSGRSIAGFDLHAALTGCHDLLERYGGHAMAAGLTIRRDRVDAFRARLAELVAARVPPDQLGPQQRVDLEIDLPSATAELERLARHLEPCGAGNPGPVFGVRGVHLGGAREVGTGHLKATLEDAGHRLPAIGFHWAERGLGLTGRRVDVALRLEENEYRGTRSLQARICALAPAGAA